MSSATAGQRCACQHGFKDHNAAGHCVRHFECDCRAWRPMTPAPVPPASGLSDERLAELTRLAESSWTSVGGIARELLAEVRRTRSDAALGAAVRAALEETKQGHGVLMAYPDNKHMPFGAAIWDGLFRFDRTDATRVLAALLSGRSPEGRTST